MRIIYANPIGRPPKSLSRRANSMLFKEASNNSLSKPLSHSSCKVDSTMRCKSACLSKLEPVACTVHIG